MMPEIPFEQMYREHVPLLNKLREVNAIPVDPKFVGFGAAQVRFEINEKTREDCEKAANFIRAHLMTTKAYGYPNNPLSEHVSLEVEPTGDTYDSHHLVFTTKTEESEDLLRALFVELKKR